MHIKPPYRSHRTLSRQNCSEVQGEVSIMELNFYSRRPHSSWPRKDTLVNIGASLHHMTRVADEMRIASEITSVTSAQCWWNSRSTSRDDQLLHKVEYQWYFNNKTWLKWNMSRSEGSLWSVQKTIIRNTDLWLQQKVNVCLHSSNSSSRRITRMLHPSIINKLNDTNRQHEYPC